MKNLVFILLIGIGSISIKAQNLDTFFSKTDAFLKENVSEGKVAYSKIHQNQEALDHILKMAENILISIDDENQYQAFLINAYNLLVIKGIVANYPINSPLDIVGFFDKTTYRLSGKNMTLNHIEHELLRARFNDAHFHFVLVCGALGCPPLINQVYLPTTLNAQLDQQTTLALNGSFLKIDRKKKHIKVSQIMNWYKADFTINGMSEIDFINKFRTEKLNTNFKISYYPYNWKLNEQ